MADGFFSRLKNGLVKTRQGFVNKIEQLVKGSSELNDDFYDELESILIMGDIGARTASRVVNEIRVNARKNGYKETSQVREALKQELAKIVRNSDSTIDTSKKPTIIVVVGVNGVGKTTTIGKIAHDYQEAGLKVLVAAGDTFRAAAIDQLGIWADRAGVEMVKREEGSDPAAVAFDAVKKAKEEKADVVIIDTAGRLHTKVNLMDELKKIRRVVSKEIPDAPHEILLVLDATTGQNAVSQAKVFLEAVQVTGIVLTKLDGTAKGGVVIAICDELHIPVKMIGVGEHIGDLKAFNPDDFINALFD